MVGEAKGAFSAEPARSVAGMPSAVQFEALVAHFYSRANSAGTASPNCIRSLRLAMLPADPLELQVLSEGWWLSYATMPAMLGQHV